MVNLYFNQFIIGLIFQNSLLMHYIRNVFPEIVRFLTKLSLCFFLLMIFSECETSYHVTEAGKQIQQMDEVSSKGFVYAIPTTTYKISIEGRIKKTIKGPLSAFHHLIKYPSGMKNKESRQLLQIDSLALKAYTEPDFNRVYNVRLPKPKPSIFQKSAPSYRMTMGKNLMLKGTNYKGHTEDTINQPDCHLINKHVTIPEQTSMNKSVKEESLKFDQTSLKQSIDQLLNLNQSLVAELKKTRNDSVITKDSLFRTKLEKMEDEVDSYLSRIKQIKGLFEAYRGENLAEKAQKFSDIIHKLVELKTTIAGGDAAINYPNTSISPMIQAIDTMITNYLKPFKTSNKEQRLQWEIPFHPTEDSLNFHFAIFKTDQGQYYIDDRNDRSDYKALITINIEPESLENLTSLSHSEENINGEANQKGLVYNVPGKANLTINLKIPDKGIRIPLAKSSITLPQLGVANRLPLDRGRRHYQLDPYTGALKVIQQNKSH